jgi:steroid delta-isomerase-like uncharacterized protein
MSTEENEALLRRAWDEVYGQGRLDSVEEFVLDDVMAHEPDRDVRGIEEFERYLATYLAAFPDTSVTIEDVIAEGEKVVSRYTVRGTHTGTTEDYGPPTGRQIVTEGITIYHFSGGKIAEMWDRYDNLAVMQQMGLMSEAERPSPNQRPAHGEICVEHAQAHGVPDQPPTIRTSRRR